MSASNKSKDRDYSSPSYWDERYATVEECFDWYQDYDNLKPFLSPYLRNEDIEILIPGCGNSITLAPEPDDANELLASITDLKSKKFLSSILTPFESLYLGI